MTKIPFAISVAIAGLWLPSCAPSDQGGDSAAPAARADSASGSPADPGTAGAPAAWWDALPLEEHVRRYEAEGHSRKEAMRLAARDRGLSRRDVYQSLLGAER